MFYQNVFDQEFIGILVLGDRQLSMNFRIAGNKNTSVEMIGWNVGPYNLTGNTSLTLNYSLDSGYSWTSFSVNVSSGASNIAAVTAYEVVAALNADSTFSALYTASVRTDGKSNVYPYIRASKPREKWKSYISNTSAESIIRFNKKAGVKELPSFFSKHTIANRYNYTESTGMLIELSNPVAGVDVAIVQDAGLSTTVQEDWQLLKGFSGMFTFTKNTVDVLDRVTEKIEFGSGAIAGDFAKKTTYTYTGYKLTPDTIAEVPYVLQSADISGIP